MMNANLYLNKLTLRYASSSWKYKTWLSKSQDKEDQQLTSELKTILIEFGPKNTLTGMHEDFSHYDQE